MRRLIAITTLGLTLGFYSFSFASDSCNTFGVQLPIVKSEVENKVNGGNVENDFMSLCITPQEKLDLISCRASPLRKGVNKNDGKNSSFHG